MTAGVMNTWEYMVSDAFHHPSNTLDDIVIIAIDEDKTVCKTLEELKPDIFANGGDRVSDNVPEVALCKKMGCKLVFNVGGSKVRSSSEIIKKAGQSF